MSKTPPQGYVRQTTLHRYRAKAKRDQCLRDKLRAEIEEQREKIQQLMERLEAEKVNRDYWVDKYHEAVEVSQARDTNIKRITARMDLIRAEIEELQS
jgi:hypothetical protein